MYMEDKIMAKEDEEELMDDEEVMEMSEEEAKAYLTRKKKDVNKENIAKVMKEGKIYGDPIVEMNRW